MNKIEITNTGPINHLSIPAPEGGGVVEFLGVNGSGKSTAIRCIEALARPDGRKELQVKDGAKAGSIEGLGIRISLGKINRASGELVCESLESSVDPSVFVDPGLKDPEAADRRRLSMLIRLLGIPLQSAEWKAAMVRIGGEALAQIVEDACEMVPNYDDPAAVADRLRRRIHEKALEAERETETHQTTAQAILATIEGVDISQPCDEKALRDLVTDRTVALLSAQEAQRSHLEANRRAVEAQKALGQAMAEYSGPSAAQATKAREGAERATTTAREAVLEAQAALERAKQTEREVRQAEQVARDHENTISAWKAQLEKAVPDPVPQDVIEDLVKEKEQAMKALEQGAAVREAKVKQLRAEEATKQALLVSERAGKLRDLAKSTDKVLQEALAEAKVNLLVQDGRLCIQNAERTGGLEFVSDLSHGERWRLALDLAAKKLGEGAILTTNQEAWESLDDENRAYVRSLAKARKLTIYTARVDMCPLKAEVYNATK